eukprot:CAMPEP_0171069598 /NCGR_PEP_ID=MMETSP0766_2-20121228/9243_1 /TAXON_ID=439317 /ORGANISM="Gambierdiscus australes, Strain CAWD 149" /LENGTH=72 /DNA_ID=CAMNT_0011525991 /DNA_START=131 /DNA_END=349 /DNA_ORIENTATION=-
MSSCSLIQDPSQTEVLATASARVRRRARWQQASSALLIFLEAANAPAVSVKLLLSRCVSAGFSMVCCTLEVP